MATAADSVAASHALRYVAGLGLEAVLHFESVYCDQMMADAVIETASAFLQIKFLIWEENWRMIATIMEELPRVWPFGRTLFINDCNDTILELAGALSNLETLVLDGLQWLTDDGVDRFVGRASRGRLNDLSWSGNQGRVLSGAVICRLLSIPSLTKAAFDCPIERSGAPLIANYLKSPACASLKTLAIKCEWGASPAKLLTMALADNESLTEFRFQGWVVPLPLIPHSNVTLNATSMAPQQPIIMRNWAWQRQRQRCVRCLMSAVIEDAVANEAAVWFPDLRLRIEREAVRLQKSGSDTDLEQIGLELAELRLLDF